MSQYCKICFVQVYVLYVSNIFDPAIDHCADETDNCDDNADCSYTGPGTFSCECHDGYIGDGIECDGRFLNFLFYHNRLLQHATY